MNRGINMAQTNASTTSENENGSSRGIYLQHKKLKL